MIIQTLETVSIDVISLLKLLIMYIVLVLLHNYSLCIELGMSNLKKKKKSGQTSFAYLKMALCCLFLLLVFFFVSYFKTKNNPEQIRLKYWLDKFTKLILSRYTDWDVHVHVYKHLLELAWSSGAGRVIKPGSH